MVQTTKSDISDQRSMKDQLQLLKEQYNGEKETLSRYQRLLDAMDRGELTEELLEECPELAKVKTENDKLKYRIEILKNSIAEQERTNASRGIGTSKPSEIKSQKSDDTSKKEDKSKRGNNSNSKTGVSILSKQSKKYNYIVVEDYGDSIVGVLKHLFDEAVKKAYPDVEDIPIAVCETAVAKFGDYQFNSAMAISQKLSQLTGTKVAPRDIAQKIVDNLGTCDKIEKTEIAGPGYINIFLKKSSIAQAIARIAIQGVSLPRISKRRVVVDFSSPNIAKQMHVGHLRSTIIGDGICNLLEYVGFTVVRLNHVGDWGTQFGMLIAHLQDRYPNFLVETPPIADLQAFYKDEAFKARAYECVVKLQSYDKNFVRAWQMICDVSRKDFTRIYDRLGIRITERGESFYQDLMQGVVNEIDSKGFIQIEEGRKLMFPSGCEVPLTVVKSDGGNTYDTSDLAALKHRLEVEEADWIIYVVDAGQSLHFQTIFAAGRDLGWYKPDEKRIEHVAFGLVLGDDRKKFKTRSGDTIRLTDLLDEGVRRAEMKLAEKERDKVMSEEELNDAKEAVAYGCIKYADLSQTRTQDYVFSFDKMLDDRGNTAVYLLYAYARIRSICRTAGVPREEIIKYAQKLDEGCLTLEHPAEYKLAKTVLKFSDCILTVLDSLLLHQLCDYVYSLATTFHDFYNECYVIHKDREGKTTIYYHRLVLCQVTADIMEICLKILGIRTVQRM
ncbi:unnamed protein product [Anisakis simplex]|uniref:Probable arginine--tRNA ligase, cytoplasmic n=1 Tax=Anisakis simplex TaxID=6269 RepID=A0A0M3K674_ANISI|nr:unnamed protein product [Anisakis simplex]